MTELEWAPGARPRGRDAGDAEAQRARRGLGGTRDLESGPPTSVPPRNG